MNVVCQIMACGFTGPSACLGLPHYNLKRLAPAVSQVYALDIEEYMQRFSAPFFERAGVSGKVCSCFCPICESALSFYVFYGFTCTVYHLVHVGQPEACAGEQNFA